jgi:hypothetical protein
MLGRSLPVPVRLARSDQPNASVAFKKGDNPVVVTGPVSELVMWVFGRDEVRDLTYEGPDDAVARLQSSERSV